MFTIQKQLHCVFKKTTSFLGEKAPAGAPSPSTVLLRGILSVYMTKPAISSQKLRMSLFRRKKAPAGAPSPSTILLRGILSVSETKTAILCYQTIRMSLLGRKKAPAGALSPSTVLFCLYNI